MNEFWLNSPHQRNMWGPFQTPERAWEYLFGHKPTEGELKGYREAGWEVRPVPQPTDE